MRPSLLHDPEKYQEIVECIGLGLPCGLIAKTIQKSENTVKGWLRRKDINRDASIHAIKNLKPALEKVRDRMPHLYVAKHPETRETWGDDVQQAAGVTINLISRSGACDVVDVELVQPKQIEGNK